MVKRAESDPNVKSVEGIVKSNGSTISAAIPGIDFLEPDGDGSSLVGVATISGTFDPGNLLTTNLSGEIIDAGVPAPSGYYGDVVGPAESTDKFIPAFSGTSGKALIESGIQVGGAGEVNLTTTGVITSASFVGTGTADTKIGDVGNGNYSLFTYTTGLMSSVGNGGINWSAINPITTDGVNWTQFTDDTSVNWTEVTKLSSGGSVSFSETTPTIAAGAAAGGSPTINIEGSDGSGAIILVTGSSPTTSATIATITFDSTFTHNPIIDLTPMNAASAALSGAKKPYWDYASASTTTAVLKSNTTALDAETTYIWGYQTIGH